MGKSIKVLILDDEIDMAMTMGDMLEFLGDDFQHEIAVNVHEALDLVEKHQFDCIISDIYLPGIDGLEFIQKLRALGNKTPVIITSGRSDYDIREKILQAGGFDFLPKPFDISNINNMVLASINKAS